MSIHYTLFWLLLTAAFGKSDLGLIGMVVATIGLLAVPVALVGILRKPSWQLLWFALPLAVVHVFLQVVCVWLIGDHHETTTLSIYAAALLSAMIVAVYAARRSPLAAAGAAVFALVYGWTAFEVSLFVFWNGLH